MLQNNKTRFHSRVNGYKGLTNHLLLQAHTCVLQNTSMQRCTERQGLRRWADQILLGAYTGVLQNRRIQGCTSRHRLQRFGRQVAAVSTRICVSQNTPVHGCTQHSRSHHQRLHKGLADHLLLRAHTCVLQNRSMHRGSRFTKVWPTQSCWPTSCCCQHINVCCRICHFKIAIRGQGLQGFGVLL